MAKNKSKTKPERLKDKVIKRAKEIHDDLSIFAFQIGEIGNRTGDEYIERFFEDLQEASDTLDSAIQEFE